MKETDILNKIRNNWRVLHLIHIESNTTMGIPDVNFCHQGKDVWMELKILRESEDTSRVYMEKFQVPFHLTRNMRGGICLIFAADRSIIKILRMSTPEQAAKGVDYGKFRRYDTEDLELIIEWERPFKWDKMLVEFMEKLKCL